MYRKSQLLLEQSQNFCQREVKMLLPCLSNRSHEQIFFLFYLKSETTYTAMLKFADKKIATLSGEIRNMYNLWNNQKQHIRWFQTISSWVLTGRLSKSLSVFKENLLKLGFGAENLQTWKLSAAECLRLEQNL